MGDMNISDYLSDDGLVMLALVLLVAMATIEVSAMNNGYLIEVEAIAAVGSREPA